MTDERAWPLAGAGASRLRVALLVLAACLIGAPTALAQSVRWEQWVHLPRVVDVAGPRSDGSLVASARGRLYLVSAAGKVRTFAPHYSANPGAEPYITTTGVGCFPRDEVYALDGRKAVVGIDAT